jgi:hypothetical protein
LISSLAELPQAIAAVGSKAAPAAAAAPLAGGNPV